MRTLICSIFALSILAITINATQDHCYALALEGGGDKGAYQAGALSEILRHHGDETVQYDVISGIGVGAINGAHLSSFEKGQEDTAADSLISLWRGLTVSQVYKSWRWGGIVRGLLFETGIYDNTPLKTYLKSHIKSPKREFYYGLVNSKTG
jgi:NTE family protein